MQVTGTLVWYYFICHREVWLLARQIIADQDHEDLDMGRFIQETSYSREKKEVAIDNIRVDLIQRDGEELVISEVKKSSRFEQGSRMQLLFYLYKFKQKGVNARGELRFPKEKRKETVCLTEAVEKELERIIHHIRTIIKQPVPPPPVKCKYCGKCAYYESCWV
ncbi:CRISPR-associated protein Cas4 [Kroppenstedtia guangzhouensis]|uniref:CRISPR-associated exonuclease Cas4 n=1 Tax=Kroppenstedtia guangzhouensis TaxID=1274356 RepID=A0ABQ1G0B4_9BACL|nr:CRISPR-associated protein Cas4 [Kroppenstedtia guangzhouensis]GGA34206.1 CRISPR-associated protein Cas4 [Kroppenstedtia guangzhouensis]